MKLKIFYLLCVIICNCTIAFGQVPGIEYLLLQDMNPLFKSTNMYGVLGEDYSLIDMRFTDTEKINDRNYHVKGVSRTRLVIICDFEGQITIDSIDFRNKFKDEGTDIDGFICGHYTFVEKGKTGYSGVFSGAFKQAFRLENEKICNPVNDIVENKLNTAEYVGVWKMGNITKICNWADEIIPGIAEDFCRFNDAGEWIVNPQYRKNGWDNLYNAYYNNDIPEKERLKAESIEQEQWWLN